MCFEHPTTMVGKVVISSILINFIFFQTVYGQYDSLVTLEEKECTKVGFMCANCTTSMYCVPNPDGTFHPEYLECGKKQSCFESNGKCAEGVNKDCPISNDFICHQPGVFPDPSYCNTYHICQSVNDIPAEISCGANWMYSAKTGKCTERYTGSNCPQPVINCKEDFELGKIIGDPRMYYICQRRTDEEGKIYLYPELYYCDNAFVFNGTVCVDSTPDTGLDSNGKCKTSGYFYYPSDCTKYNQCTSTGGNPVSGTCAIGYKFNPTTHTCQLFNCNNCE